MSTNNSTYTDCEVCGKDIRYGNAVLEIERNVEQHEFEEETDLHSVTVIDADPLVTLCARCGNSLHNDERDLYERKARLLERALRRADEMDKKDLERWQLILKVGAEGGCICLYGQKDKNGEWQFLRETDERMLTDMLSGDDRKGLSFYSKTGLVTGWHNALEILSRYPWPCLCPLYVHQEFRDAVFMALKDYSGDLCEIDFRRWDAVCAGRDIYE